MAQVVKWSSSEQRIWSLTCRLQVVSLRKKWRLNCSTSDEQLVPWEAATATTLWICVQTGKLKRCFLNSGNFLVAVTTSEGHRSTAWLILSLLCCDLALALQKAAICNLNKCVWVFRETVQPLCLSVPISCCYVHVSSMCVCQWWNYRIRAYTEGLAKKVSGQQTSDKGQDQT